MLLYKYTRARHLEQIVVRGMLAFPTVDQLNDPYESSVDFAIRELQPWPREPDAPNPSDHFGYGGMESSLEVGLEYSRWEWTCKEVERRNQASNDFNRRRADALQVLQRFRSGVGVLSLTADPGVAVMWAHYAEAGRGICVGLEFSGDEMFPYLATAPQEFRDASHLFAPLRVRYRSKPIRPDDIRPIAVAYAAFFTKANEWAYEREYRILCPVESSNRPIDVPIVYLGPLCVRELVLGWNASPDLRDRAESLRVEAPHLRLSQLVRPEGEYCLKKFRIA